MRRLLLIGAVLLLGGSVDAQVLDGFYVKQHNFTKQVIPQPSVREADVLWSKRVWRRIDVRQKINQHLYFPIEKIRDRQCFFDVVSNALNEGLITMYDEDGNGTCEFTKPFPPDEVASKFGYKASIREEDEMTGEVYTRDTVQPFTAEMLSSIDIKEDWYFDKEKSELRVEIIGVSLQFKYDSDDGPKTARPGFFYFPELQYVLANYEVYNMSGNDSERRSFLDVFLKRQFASYVRKESNVYDRFIQDYKAEGLGQLAESERIKGEIFEFEHDLWSY